MNEPLNILADGTCNALGYCYGSWAFSRPSIRHWIMLHRWLCYIKTNTRPTQFQLYTSLRHIAFTNTIFVYFGVLFIVLYAWPAFCHAIIKRILMMIDDGDAFVLCVQIRRKKRMTALLTVSLRNNSVLVSLKYSQHNAEIAFQ